MGGSIADGVGIGVTLPIMRRDLHLTGGESFVLHWDTKDGKTARVCQV